MSARTFAAIHVPGQGVATRIICSCGNHEDIFINRTGVDRRNVSTLFSRRGWRVGQSPRKDRCPTCLAKHKTHQPEEPAKMAQDTKIIDIRSPSPGASDRPPREMTKADRRLIIQKLEEVYEDELTGYIAGWHDQRVAVDMAVPRAWVEQLREENFGPIKADQSAEVLSIKAAIEEGEKLIEQANRELAEVKRGLSSVNDDQLRLENVIGGVVGLLNKAKIDLDKLTGKTR